ncbi:MAG: hypothetical protein DWC02_04990 [Candidatus Poseidoniales archaeon]|nr:MAG: hypothetical protein DWC02_04990 [Candidatus Poseidoniales archaeon]
MTALLLLAGCLDAEDAEDKIEIVGCGDEDALNYNEEATDIQDDLCSSEEELEEAIVEFINFMDEGPDIETLDTTIGFSMEVSEVYANTDECEEWEYWNPDLVDESQPYNGCPSVSEEVWYFMETVLVSPDGLKSSIEDRYGDSFSTEEVIYYGNQIQYSMTGTDDEGNEQSMELRMSHSGTFESIYNMGNDDEDMDDDMGDEMVCHDMNTHTNDYSIDNEEDCEDSGGIWITDDGHGDEHGDDHDGDDMDEEEDENPESDDYTGIFDPVSATFSGFEVTDSGMTFSGMLNVEDAPFGAMNVYTNSDMEITGFDLMDVENEDNWVKFQLLNSGDISIDESIEQHALPFMLMDMNEFGDDHDHSHDDEGMVCYDIETHTIVDIHEEDDCWDAGYMWTSMDGGDDDDDGNDPYWTFNREMSECDSDGDLMLDWYELDDCVYLDLTNDGLAEGYDSDSIDYMFNNSDIDSDGLLDVDELSYLNCMVENMWSPDKCDHSSDHDHDDGPTFICGDGSEIPFHYVNDGDADCDDGADEQQYDTDGNEINWFDCMDGSEVWISQVNDGTDDCPDGEDEAHDDHDDHYYDEPIYYDGCTESTDPEDSYYECWMNDWVDSDGNIMESDGYEMDECTDLEPGWECMRHDGHDDEMVYHCLAVVDFNDGNHSSFDSTNLDDSMCGQMVTDMDYTFTETTMTLPEHLLYEECWENEDNATMCETGEIIFNSTGVWDIFMDDYESCHGDFNNATEICVEWLGNMVDADGHAFLIDDGEYEILILYEYDSSTMSGYLILMDSPEPMDIDTMFDMMDSDENGEVTLTEWTEMFNESDDGEEITQDDIDRMSVLFDMYDQDESGGLNITEFADMMWEIESGNMEDSPEIMFAMIDTNDDDEVTLLEWTEMANNSDDEPLTDEDYNAFAAMFAMHDDDENGGLDFDEFMNMFDAMDDDMEENLEFIFLIIDANNDGEVTSEEWIYSANQNNEDGETMSSEEENHLSNMVDMYDDDDSGGLNFAEFENMMDAMEDMDEDGGDITDSMQVLVVVGMDGGIGGSLNDYSLTLANCDDLDEDENLNDLDCSDDIWSMTLSDIQVTEDEMMTSGLSIMYMDTDSSDSLTTGDVIMIDHSTLDVDEDWNTARLYSEEADSYSDENPALPGFTGIIATIGLLGAALLRRD